MLCFFYKDFIHLFLERGEGREKDTVRNTDVWERNIDCCLLCTLWPGNKSATQACALTRIKPATF